MDILGWQKTESILKECVALDKAQVSMVLSDGLVCFSKSEVPRGIVALF